MEEEKEVLTCEFCKEYTGNANQVRGHRIHCKANPAKTPPPDGSATSENKPETKAEVKTESDPKRKERIPFGAPQRKLNAPDGDGYHYHVFNDNWRKEPGRVQRAIRAGYEKVEGFEPVAVGSNDDGSAIKGILMKIPQELYDQDQKLKQKEVDRVDEAIKGGTVEQKAGDKRYLPDRYVPEGIRIHSNNNENR